MRRRIQPHEPPERMTSLRTAFVYDVRPDAYLANAAWTVVVAAIVMAAMVVWRGDTLVPALLLPLNGWVARNPDNVLYAEVWANILANALQIAFAFWAGILILLGLGRLIFARKFVRTCFTLGVAFTIMAVAAPPLTAFFFNWLIRKYPLLSR